MSAADILNQLRALPPAERRHVIGKIWEEFGEVDLDLTSERAAELERRAADYAAHPEKVVAWNEIKAAAEAKHGTQS